MYGPSAGTKKVAVIREVAVVAEVAVSGGSTVYFFKYFQCHIVIKSHSFHPQDSL